jgi:hypothetical protein
MILALQYVGYNMWNQDSRNFEFIMFMKYKDNDPRDYLSF